MLPPKRSTRSAHIASQPVQEIGSHVHNDHPYSLDSDVVENSTPHPIGSWTPQAHFLFNTPRTAYTNQDILVEAIQKKARRKLTAPQRLALEELASHGNSPSLEARRTLAAELGLELKVVSVWFQNKRRPTSKANEGLRVDLPQSQVSDKRNQGSRQVLADVNTNDAMLVENSLDEVSYSFPEVSSAPFPSISMSVLEQDRAPSGIWDFLPTSPLGSGSEACNSETSLLIDEATPCPLKKQNKRRSLEWACMNDERTTKRARTSFNYEPLRRTCTSSTPIGNALQCRRQRTDKKPPRPSFEVVNTGSRRQPHGSSMRSASFGGCAYIEKDILDVALALLQLKDQGPLNFVRGSI